MYYYREAVKADVLEYIRNEIDFSEFDTLDELEEKLNDDLWTVDSVTGNASGSYTFNRWTAKEYVVDGMDELKEALREFGTPAETIAEKFLDEDWEHFDVTIRCYLLGECIAAALEELEDEFEEAHEEAEEDEK